MRRRSAGIVCAFFLLTQHLVAVRQSATPRVLFDDSTVCSLGYPQYRVRNILLQIAPQDYSEERLATIISRFEPRGTPYHEVSIWMISAEREAQLLTQAYVANDASIMERRVKTEMLARANLSVAEYYRVRQDAAVRFTGQDGIAQKVLLSGADPFTVPSSVSFTIVRNLVQVNPDGNCLRRDLYLVVCPSDYSEVTALSLCRLMDVRFPLPNHLEIHIRENAKDLQQEMLGYWTMNAIYPFVLDRDSPALRCRTEARGSTYYIRSSKGREYSYGDRANPGNVRRKIMEKW